MTGAVIKMNFDNTKTTFTGHKRHVFEMHTVDDLFITISSDRCAKIWDEQGKCLETYSAIPESNTRHFSAISGKNLLIVAKDCIESWDIEKIRNSMFL